ncbi:MAG: hypothetical protein K2G28_07905 [Acetatifactor sp.]|nr:hypothetical protein [Acetatifactor sp.]MDE7353429.1 hypothetical protein [Acetatifactor sp.]
MEQGSENHRFCRKCLTRELADSEETYKNLWEYIDNLDADIKSPEELYQERLEICRKCDLLLEAMCRSCGCYVELRAAVERNGCPCKKW